MAGVGIFETIGTSIQNALDKFITPVTGEMVSFILPYATIGVMIYFTFMGLMIVAGRVETPMSEFTSKCAKIAFIAAFALSASFFQEKVMGGIQRFEEGMSTAVAAAATKTPASNIYQTLDQGFDKGYELAKYAFKKASDLEWYSLGQIMLWYGVGIVFAICICALVLAGGVTILIAKFMLTLVFGVGPVFVVALMFPATKQYFDKWFSQAMTYVLTMVFVAMIVALVLFIFEEQTKTMVTKLGSDDINPIMIAVQVALITIILVKITTEVSQLAASLAGGMAMASLSAGAAIAGAAGGALAGAAAAKRFFGKESTRSNVGKDSSGKPILGGSDGAGGSGGGTGAQQMTGSRLGHIIAGRSMANHRYIRGALNRAMSNAKQNWLGDGKGGGIEEKAA